MSTRTWLFRGGLVLTVVGAVAGAVGLHFTKPVAIRWSSSGAGSADLGFFTEYTEVNVVPITLTLGGLIMMAIAKMRRR